ncbi:MAG: tetratricopeptide repeat protein [Deltaproteobacteria bacterium]|nr:MAG: tetratricopeptide repeat protein [Deltaproteobacteria bacterium]
MISVRHRWREAHGAGRRPPSGAVRASVPLVLVLLAGGCFASARRAAQGGAVASEAPTTADATPGPTGAERRAFEDAVEAYRQQQAAGVLDLAALETAWRRVTERAPDLAEGWFNLGAILERQGKLDEAEAAYRQALAKNARLKVAALNLAVLVERRGDVGQATKMYQAILKAWPDDAEARVHLARIHLRRGDARRAEALAREALARQAGHLGAYKVLLEVAAKEGNRPLARLFAAKAQHVAPGDPELFLDLARLDLAEKETEKAIANLLAAVEKDPDYLPAHRLLARIAFENEDWVTASRHLEQVVARDPEDLAAWLDLGIARRALGQAEEAEAAYARVLELDPDHPEALFDRAVLRYRLEGRSREALEDLRRFLAQRRVAADHPARALAKEIEAVLKAEEEARRMEAEARRKEEAAKQAQLEAEIQAAKSEGGVTSGAASDAEGAEAGRPPPEEGGDGASESGAPEEPKDP